MNRFLRKTRPLFVANYLVLCFFTITRVARGAWLSAAVLAWLAVSSAPEVWPIVRSWVRKAPTRTQADPIRATKRASIEGSTLFGMVAGAKIVPAVKSQAVYSADDRATCMAGKDHRAPDPDCECGFYAVSGRVPRMIKVGTNVTLDVELFGRVVRHGKTYRAERQRVLRATLDRCKTCKGPKHASRGIGYRSSRVWPWASSCGRDVERFIPIEQLRAYLRTEVVAAPLPSRKDPPLGNRHARPMS